MGARDARLPAAGPARRGRAREVDLLRGRLRGAASHRVTVYPPECGWPKGIDSTGFIGGSTSNGVETTLEGLVPDGNPTVTLVLANGARKAFPMTDNVYEATFKGRVVAVVNRDIHDRVVRTTLQ